MTEKLPVHQMAQGKGKGETSYVLKVVWLQLNKDTDWLANHQQPLVAIAMMKKYKVKAVP